MAGRRLSDQEFLTVLAAPAPPPGWDLDAEGDFHVLRFGEAVVFARERDLAFARYLTL